MSVRKFSGLAVGIVVILVGICGRSVRGGEDPVAETVKMFHRVIANARGTEEEIKEKVERERARLQREFEELSRLASVTIEIGGEEVTVTEPGNIEQLLGRKPSVERSWLLSEADLGLMSFDPWSLAPTDFRQLEPRFLSLDYIGLGSKLYMVLPFRLTNSTDKKRIIAPHIWIATEEGSIVPEAAKLVPKEAIEKALAEPLETVDEMTGFNVKAPDGSQQMVQAFEPGETRPGVAIFPQPDMKMDHAFLVVQGLTNVHDYEHDLERLLVLEYSHPGDEFAAHRDPMRFVGKGWRKKWMWFEACRLANPTSVEVTTPRGKKHTVWSYEMAISNKTGFPVQFVLEEVATVVVFSFKGKPLDVRMADNGQSSIYKHLAMEELGRPFVPDRFKIGEEGEVGELAPGDAARVLVLFDENDINFETLYEEIAYARTPSMVEHIPDEAVATGTGLAPRPVRAETSVELRALSQNEQAKVKKGFLDGLPAMIEEQIMDPRRIVADLRASSRLMVSGFDADMLWTIPLTETYRVSRSLIQRTPVDRALLYKPFGEGPE